MFNNLFEISTESAAVLKIAFEAIWTAPGRLLASILDQNGILDPRARASKTPLTTSSEHDFKCHLNPSGPPPGAWKFTKVRSKN